MASITFKAFTEDSSQIEALKAFMKALKIKFEVSTDKEYNPDFVKKIQQGDVDFEAGKGKKTSLDELNSLWK